MSRHSQAAFAQTTTDLDELGVILPTDNKRRRQCAAARTPTGISPARFMPISLSSSRALQIDVVGESQLVGYPTQFPSVSMMDWTNNQPNARFWVLKLIKDSLPSRRSACGDVHRSRDVSAQAFVTPGGHKLLLVNKRNREIEVAVPDADKATALAVDS